MRLGDVPRGETALAPTGKSRRSGGGRNPVVWSGNRAGIFSAARLAVMRLRSGAALLPMVGIGILVAVVLICVVPLYTLLGEDVQLQQALAQSIFAENTPQSDVTTISGFTRNVAVQTLSPIDPSLVGTAQPIVTRIEHQYLSGFTEPTPTFYLASGQVILTQAGSQQFDPASGKTPDAVFESYDWNAIAAHIQVLQGTLPSATDTACVIDAETATARHINVGDKLSWTAFGDHTITLTLPVAAIIQQKSSNDPFWNGLSLKPATSNDHPDIYPIFVTQPEFFRALQPFNKSGLQMSQNWIFYTQPGHITSGNATSIQANLGQFVTSVNGDLTAAGNFPRVVVATSLNQTLNDVLSQQGLLALPLYIIVAQVLGLALLFVAVMSGLLIEGQAGDISTLKSRGVSAPQLLGIYATQGLLLGIICLIVGPIAASALALFLLKRFVTAAASVDASYLTRIASPTAVLVPALIGIGLGVLMIAFSAFQAARLDVLAFRREQARPTRVPFWQRYYLDLALVVLCIVGYVELGQFGGATVRAQLGGGANPLLLLTPAFLLLGGALLVLRLVPLAAALGARLAARGRGITSLLALAQVERSPGRYARMTLLLVLAVGLGLFALTFNASLARNIRDHTTYGVGADFVVQLGDHHQLSTKQVAMYQQLPGVLRMTQVDRTTAYVNPNQGNFGTNVLTIDPKTFASVVNSVSWRADYANVPLTKLMSELEQHQGGTSAGMPGHPIWAIISQATADNEHLSVGDAFAVQLYDSAGGPVNLVVGAIIPAFPTLYPAAEPDGFMVLSSTDYANAVYAGAPAGQTVLVTPNEFWFHTTENPATTAKMIKTLNGESGDIGGFNGYTDLVSQLAAAESNPIAGGMRGLLLIGALTAAGLAVLGSLVQGILAANQRVLQFAILRTIGMSGRQILGQLLGEQLVVYFFGLVGGTVLGLLLTTATLPFLQFSEGAVNPVTLGTPPYLILFDGRSLLVFYLALVVAVLVALLIAARHASAVGLGKALRLGAD